MVDTGHRIVIVGGGSAGITVAARLRRKGQQDIAVIEPAATHYYQPLWTLVGGGRAPVEVTARPESKVMPKGVTWIRQAAVGADPETRTVALDDGSTVEYDKLVMCPGIQLDWEKITGLRPTLGRDGVSSNYVYELAPATWRFIRELRSGTAVFTMPSGPIKCAGAPQKIAYLAADYWREQGVLDKIDMHLVLPTPGMFGVKVFADVLEQTARRYGEPARRHGGPCALGLLRRIRLVSAHAAWTRLTSHEICDDVPEPAHPGHGHRRLPELRPAQPRLTSTRLRASPLDSTPAAFRHC